MADESETARAVQEVRAKWTHALCSWRVEPPTFVELLAEAFEAIDAAGRADERAVLARAVPPMTMTAEHEDMLRECFYSHPDGVPIERCPCDPHADCDHDACASWAEVDALRDALAARDAEIATLREELDAARVQRGTAQPVGPEAVGHVIRGLLLSLRADGHTAADEATGTHNYRTNDLRRCALETAGFCWKAPGEMRPWCSCTAVQHEAAAARREDDAATRRLVVRLRDYSSRWDAIHEADAWLAAHKEDE